MLSTEERIAIDDFFTAVEKLRSLEIIRSNRFLGDLGEFIASRAIGLQLNQNKRQKGFDAIFNNKKYEVKYSNGTKTNISLGNPNEYDFIVLVIGSRSVLFDSSILGNYAIYELPASVALNYPNDKGGYSFGKSVLHTYSPIAII